MKMIDVVLALRAKGHEVDYYERKDGGILVKRIDDERYTSGASGNARARQLVGVNLSEARASQLKYATRVRKRKKVTLDDEIEKEYKRVKRKWDKAFKSKKGRPHPAGYFGKSRIEYAVKTYGKAEALRRIKEAERYASGIAYSKNVQILAGFIRDAGEKYNSKALLDLAEDLTNNAYLIKEEWIVPAYEALYKLNSGANPEEVARTARAILRL